MYIPRQFALSDDESQAALAQAGFARPVLPLLYDEGRHSLVAHDDAEWVLNLVTMLTNRHEQRRAEPWQVTDAPESYTRAQLRAIVGVELVISKVEGKAKMSQNQPEHNRTGVVAGLKESAAPHDQLVADRVDALGSTNANGRG
jgi:transcriptional regulator